MVDVLTPEQRRLNMSRIRGKNTKPELILRRGLHARGLRFRLHRTDLPGKPDLVFPRYRSVILVHGCFWYGPRVPADEDAGDAEDFWAAKIAGNRKRDQRALAALHATGWRTLVVWESALRGKTRLSVKALLSVALSSCNSLIMLRPMYRVPGTSRLMVSVEQEARFLRRRQRCGVSSVLASVGADRAPLQSHRRRMIGLKLANMERFVCLEPTRQAAKHQIIPD